MCVENTIWGTEEERASLIVAKKNPYLHDSSKGLELMAKLTAKPARQEAVAEKLEKLHHELHGKFLHICNQEHTPNEVELFLQLHKAFKDLEELAGFHALANKNVVAVGGSFSAGKSRFINALLGDSDLLPWDTKKTTAIPTHVIKGDTETIRAINTLNNIIELDRDSFKAICHDFFRVHKVGFSHLIKLVTIEKPDFPYINITFLDTPGYSASEGMERGDNTDETIAREHLSQADYLIWVVSAKDGTIPDSDIEFLLSLNKSSLGKIPELFLVLNKADLIPLGKDLENIMKSARNGLKTANIPCVGAAAFNSLKGEQVMGDSITEYLAGIDKKNKPTMMAKKFSAVFQAFAKHNSDEQQQSQKLFGFLNPLQVRLTSILNDEEKNLHKELAETARQKSAGLKGVISQFETIASKVDGMVQGIMQDIKVKEANIEDHGIPVIGSVKNEATFATLVDGQILTGKVKHSDALGIFIDFGLGDDVNLYPKKVKERYSGDPKTLFPVGAECRAIIHGVKISERKVMLVIIPSFEG
jgi:GTPase Era involved in 16S rRNA processing